MTKAALLIAAILPFGFVILACAAIINAIMLARRRRPIAQIVRAAN